MNEHKAVSQAEIDAMKPMVRWFDPGVLFKVLKPVVLSGIFGQYADRRLMQAALDDADETELYERTQLMLADKSGAVWLDYASDTGDGFNPTYAVASLLGQPELELSGQRTERGDLLVLGGDQVYPDASRETYEERFYKPFAWAFPDTDCSSLCKSKQEDREAGHPLLYAIPGNHDWYDGLGTFLSLFCRTATWRIGNWRTRQRRSYFALDLSHGWWLWGIDIQLADSLDVPQADYFATIVERMPDNAKLIICTAVPGWLYESSDAEGAYRSLRDLTRIIHEEDRGIEVRLVLSGDTHHYSRYITPDGRTHLITAGGAGAFLHPTHNLKDEITAKWQINKPRERVLEGVSAVPSLETDPETVLRKPDDAARFPSVGESADLLKANFRFAFSNMWFTALLGGLCVVLGSLLLAWLRVFDGYAISRILGWILLTVLPLFGIYHGYADTADWVRDGRVLSEQTSGRRRKLILGLFHSTAQIAVFTGIFLGLCWIGAEGLDLPVRSFWFLAILWIGLFVIGGLAAAGVFGLYLYVTCRWLGVHTNDAFSAHGFEGYKNFLRIRIDESGLTVFPVGMKTVPAKDDWIPNPKAGVPGVPAVVPRTPLAPHLIEKPIIIP